MRNCVIISIEIKIALGKRHVFDNTHHDFMIKACGIRRRRNILQQTKACDKLAANLYQMMKNEIGDD